MSFAMTNQERRNFSRIALDRPAMLESEGRRTACELVDISLRGALVRVRAKLRAGAACTLLVHLDAGLASIRMDGAIAHVGDGTAGVRCEEIDVDSIAHLRRLVELNLGDERLLQRELSALLA